MIDRFSWLLVSDVHLRATYDTWSQRVVLRDLVRSVERRFNGQEGPRFVIVSGDLAFSGAAEEYKLVEGFLDSLAGAVRLPRRDFYLVAGNHDVNRRIQDLCFVGARTKLTSPPRVDEFLGQSEERATLFQRLSAYFEFEQRFCAGQRRCPTPDGLGYVAPINIEGLPICLLGVNSAWMCGGDDDKGNLLVGDRPTIEAIELLRPHSPRVVLGVMHHPYDWLQEHDQRSVERRLLPACEIFHRGHLHDPTSRLVSSIPGQSCLVVAAGAGYGGRLFQNSYTCLTAEISQATCRIETFLYDPDVNDFRAQAPEVRPLQLKGTIPGTPADLTAEVAKIPSAAPFANYIAALVLNFANEMPVVMRGQVIFVTQQHLNGSEDEGLVSAARGILETKNLLLAFAEDTPLRERFAEVRGRVAAYGDALRRVAGTNQDIAIDLERREANCQLLAAAPAPAPFANTIDLMGEMAQCGHWVDLEDFARRYAVKRSPAQATARRFLFVALASQDDAEKQKEACELGLDIVRSPGGEPEDYVRAATMLYNVDRHQEAAQILKEFVGRYEGKMRLITEIGQKVVVAAHDQDLAAALGIPLKKRRGGA